MTVQRSSTTDADGPQRRNVMRLHQFFQEVHELLDIALGRRESRKLASSDDLYLVVHISSQAHGTLRATDVNSAQNISLHPCFLLVSEFRAVYQIPRPGSRRLQVWGVAPQFW